MSVESLRILQVGDLSLNRPLQASGSMPVRCREIFNQANERAALKAFDTAISLKVNVLLLAGTIADVEDEPRLSCFLFEQFRRLATAGVTIVQLQQGESSLPEWVVPETFRSVSRFDRIVLSNRLTGITTEIQHGPATNSPMTSQSVLRISSPLEAEQSGLRYEWFGDASSQSSDRLFCRGEHLQPQTSDSFAESGVWFVEASPEEKLQARLISTAAVRWLTETMTTEDHETQSDMIARLQRRLNEFARVRQHELTLLNVVINGHGPLWEHFGERYCSDDLLQFLREKIVMPEGFWIAEAVCHPDLDQHNTWNNRSSALKHAMKKLDQLPLHREVAGQPAILPIEEWLGTQNADSFRSPAIRALIANSLRASNSERQQEAG